jgi:hypothetical protein
MNLNKLHLTLFLLVFTLNGHFSSAQLPAVMLTDSAKVSLLTCSQGEELYSIFGHSAIRVKDPIVGVDWVFNYGTFDFSDPNFYPNFVKGKLNYILSVSTYKNFEYTYIFENRYIYEQILNLKQYEKQLLLDSLRINYLPQNRYYLYDFLFDNCATRIRDIFVEAIPRTIEFDSTALKQGMTFRQLLMPNVKEKPWALLGINLLLGVSADRPAEPWEYMFLPEHMMTAFQHASFKTDTLTVLFAQPPVNLLDGVEIPRNRFRESPLFVFMVIFLATAFFTYKDVRRKKHSLWFDTILFGFVGLLGIVIAFQWFGSDHAVMAKNYNLIWAHPLHLIAVIMVFLKPLVKIAKIYFLASMLLLITLLIFWFFLPQVLPFPVFPLVASMAVRSVVVYKFA